MVVDPTSSKSMTRNIIIMPLWGDRWVPMKVTNLSNILLKKNCKLADVSPCLAVEDFGIFRNFIQVGGAVSRKHYTLTSSSKLELRLQDVGLGDLDISSCHADHAGKEKLV